MKISLCLIVWNEIHGCKIDVPLIPKNAFDEIYAIDGGSVDGTVKYLRGQGIPVYKQSKKGLNAAYIDAVRRSNSDAVVTFFPKGTISPPDLIRFRYFLESGYDLVIASRLISGARNEEDGKIFKIRKWGVICFAIFASLFWRRQGNMIFDVLHGYKGFTISSFKKMEILDYGLSIDLEMVTRSYRLQQNRIEIPVEEKPRSYGETHFKILPTSIKLLKYLFYELRRRE